MLGFGSVVELDADVAASPAEAAAFFSSASFSALAASGTHKPESTQRFKWYFASSSGNLLIVSWSNAMSRLSKHFWRDWKYQDLEFSSFFSGFEEIQWNETERKTVNWRFTSGSDSKTSTGSKPPGPNRALRSSSYKKWRKIQIFH